MLKIVWSKRCVGTADMSNVFRSVFSILIIFGAGRLMPAANAMDLLQAYDAAYINDATIRSSRAVAEGDRELLPQANAQRLPNVSLNAGRNHNDLTSKTLNFLGQPITDRGSYYSGSQNLTIRQPIYKPYVSALVRQAQAQVEGANATLERDEQSLVTRVVEAYFDALLAEDQLDLIAAQKKTYIAQLDAARKRFGGGSGTRTDIDEAQAQLDMTLAQELESKQNVDFTRHRLETLTGGAVASLAKLDVEHFLPAAPVPETIDLWVERAQSASPELRALRAQLIAATEEIEKAKAGHKPTIEVIAQWARSNSDSVTSVNSRYNNKSIGLQLNVPIYSGGYVNSTVRQAVAQQTRIRESLEATSRDLGVRVFKEFRGVTEGVLRISALQQAVKSAEQVVISNRKSFDGGIRTMLDVLNAEQQKTVAQRDLAQARYVYLVSRMRLHSLAGDDRIDSVAEANSWLSR